MLINFTMQTVPSGTDETYTVSPPRGVCKNKYCPEGLQRHDKLVRGYCEPCASIRVPPSQYRPAKRLKGDDWDTIGNLNHMP